MNGAAIIRSNSTEQALARALVRLLPEAATIRNHGWGRWVKALIECEYAFP
jgi:hypothetical protein